MQEWGHTITLDELVEEEIQTQPPNVLFVYLHVDSFTHLIRIYLVSVEGRERFYLIGLEQTEPIQQSLSIRRSRSSVAPPILQPPSESLHR